MTPTNVAALRAVWYCKGCGRGQMGKGNCRYCGAKRMIDTTATERQRRKRARDKAGLVAVTVEVPKTDVKALEAFAEKLRKIAKKHS